MAKITLQKHALEFVDKFLDMITDKKQLQRFLGCLNCVSNFYEGCVHDRNFLNQRLKKYPVPWTSEHTNAIKIIKSKVKTLPILYLVDEDLPKIVESDASGIGWGGILKKTKEG